MVKQKGREGFVATRFEHNTYGLFFFGQNVMWALAGLIATFMTDIGFTAELAALILIVPKIWDAVNDTLFGYLVDKVKLKSGMKFLPWVRLGTAIVGFAVILLFAIPTNGSVNVTGKIIWFLVGYLLFDAAYTMLDAPMFAMPTVMTPNIQERTSIIANGKFWSMVGAMLAAVIIPFIRPNIGWTWTAVAIVIFSVAFMLPILIKGKERHVETAAKDEAISFKQMFKYLGSNKFLFVALFAIFIMGITNVELILSIQLARICFHNEKIATIVSLCVSIPVVLIAFLVPRMAKKWDKFNVLIVGLLFSIVMSVTAWIVGFGNLVVSIVLVALKCTGLAFYNVICYMFVADTVEYGTYKSGTRASGITFSLQTFAAKLKNALVNSIALGALAIFGFVEGENAIQPEGVAEGVWTVFTMLPAIGYTIAVAALLLFYKLRDKDVQIMAQYNTGEITKEQADELLGAKFGPAAVFEEEAPAVQE